MIVQESEILQDEYESLVAHLQLLHDENEDHGGHDEEGVEHKPETVARKRLLNNECCDRVTISIGGFRFALNEFLPLAEVVEADEVGEEDEADGS